MKKEFKVISELIENKSKALDVGCGDGELLKYLLENKTKDIRGLEISKEKVQNCLSKGLPVIEGNAENDLMQFPNKSFDYVILSQTLQAFLNPDKVIKELLRVGKKAIVTIPNFGHWKIRIKLLINGSKVFLFTFLKLIFSAKALLNIVSVFSLVSIVTVSKKLLENIL